MSRLGVFIFGLTKILKSTTCTNEAELSGQQLSSKQMFLRMCAGGLAGQISWLVSYPFDIVKTVV